MGRINFSQFPGGESTLLTSEHLEVGGTFDQTFSAIEMAHLNSMGLSITPSHKFTETH